MKISNKTGIFEKTVGGFNILGVIITALGVSVFGNVSFFGKPGEPIYKPGQDPGDLTLGKAVPGPAGANDRPAIQTAATPTARTCENLVMNAADATNQGLLLKAERLQKMITDLRCVPITEP